jgi:hypothetical protein
MIYIFEVLYYHNKKVVNIIYLNRERVQSHSLITGTDTESVLI